MWYFLALIGLGLYKQHIYDHYFGFVFPVVFLLAGYLLSRTSFWITLPTIFVFSYLSISNLQFNNPGNHQIATARNVAGYILDHSQGQPFNYAGLSKMGYAFTYYLVDQPNYREIKDEKSEQLFVTCVPHPDINCQPINNPEWAIAAFGWAKIDTETEVDGVKIYRLIPNPEGKNI